MAVNPDVYDIGGNLVQRNQDDVSRLLGGDPHQTWGEYKDTRRGITSPNIGTPKGETWYSPANMGQLQGPGWINEPTGTTIPKGPGAIHRIADDYYGNEEMFRRDWYTPYFDRFVGGAAAGMGGQPGAYGSPEQTGSEFVTAEYIDPSNIVVGQDLPETTKGYLPRIAGEDPMFTLGPALDALAGEGGAKQTYEEEIDRLTWEEGHEMYDEAKAALDMARLDIARGRKDISDAKLPAYEQAQAAEAKTGMAYSAPAAQYGDVVAEESAKGMSEFSGQEQEAQDLFEGVRVQAEKDLDEAKGVYDRAVTDYETALGSYAGKSVGAADNVLGMLEGLLAAHQGMGTITKNLGKDYSKDYTTALLDRGMFREDLFGTDPQWGNLTAFAGPGGEVQTFARGMEDAARTSMEG